MKANTGWLELSLSVIVLMAVMLVVMWAQHPPATCTMPHEAVRRLVLTRETDREHLARDRASAGRIAQQHSPAAGAATEEPNACEAALVQQIVATHGVTMDQARAVRPTSGAR